MTPKLLLSTNHPNPETTPADFNNGKDIPANVGQAKRVARPFYDRLGLASPTASDDDYAALNIGQLKQLFSFEFD